MNPLHLPGPRLHPLDLALVAIVALALRLAMAWAIPLANGSVDPSCAPDEPGHLEMVRALSQGRAPTWPETRSIYGAYVPASYLVQALTLAIGGDHGDVGRFAPVEGWARGYEAARLGNALLGALAALALALAAAAWTGDRRAALAVGLAAAAYPQHVFVGAYTNGDAFTVCAGAWLAAAVARWARAGEGGLGLAAVGAAAALVVVGKPNGFYVLPATAAWLAWAAWRRRTPLRAVAAATGACALVAGPLLTWNAVRNGGDVLGLVRYRRFLDVAWHGVVARDVPDAAAVFASTLSRSAFGVFKNMGLPLPPPFFAIAAALLAVGIVAGAASLPRAPGPSRRGAAWLAGVVVTSVALNAYNCWFIDFSPQGRYVLLSALLLAAVTVWAPRAWAPARLRWAWPVACVGFLLVAAVQAQILVYKRPCLPPAVPAATTHVR